VASIVVVTTDKCYENVDTERPYRENDPLGAHDPYSGSKAAAELVAQSFRRSYFEPRGRPLLATARAGNVIGGGDWAEDRLVPDLVRSVMRREAMEMRSPHAVRPWQHVLDSLSGYLVLGQRLFQGDARAASAWNFGPRADESCTVEALLHKLRLELPNIRWKQAQGTQPHEARCLRLDTEKAAQQLKWRPIWRLNQSIAATAAWYRAYLEHESVRSAEDLELFETDAVQQGIQWASD
jgi:CDP-glucose 4,6-dehydratase